MALWSLPGQLIFGKRKRNKRVQWNESGGILLVTVCFLKTDRLWCDGCKKEEEVRE
jgi:hypothetical protein